MLEGTEKILNEGTVKLINPNNIYVSAILKLFP